MIQINYITHKLLVDIWQKRTGVPNALVSDSKIYFYFRCLWYNYGIILQTCCPFIVNLLTYSHQSCPCGSTLLVPLACGQALHFEWRAKTAERERGASGGTARGGEKGKFSFLSKPLTLASLLVCGSRVRDFSRLPLKESLLAGQYFTTCKVIRLNRQWQASHLTCARKRDNKNDSNEHEGQTLFQIFRKDPNAHLLKFEAPESEFLIYYKICSLYFFWLELFTTIFT